MRPYNIRRAGRVRIPDQVMRIFALNCGSSSIKAAVLEGTPLDSVFVARVEDPGTRDATVGLLAQLAAFPRSGPALGAVVHRVVHGGEQFSRPTLIDDRVLASLDRLGSLAPLHNPPALAVIRLAREAFPDVPHFAVFDTAFHATLPPRAREYALPQELRAGRGIRRFGFHGISHADIMNVSPRGCEYHRRSCASFPVTWEMARASRR